MIASIAASCMYELQNIVSPAYYHLPKLAVRCEHTRATSNLIMYTCKCGF